MIVSTFYCDQSTCASTTRGYPRNRLKASLKNDVTYCARYFVVNRNASPIGISDYGMLFAGNEIDTITQCRIPLPYLSPQITFTGGIISDTLYWTAISGTFTALGSEKYMVLGNFLSNANTQTAVINSSSLPQLYCDPYIDDVSLIEMELPAFAGNDTNIVVGDSAFIGREPDVGIDYACQWYQLPNDTVPIDTVAGLWVKPTTKTTYVVKQQLWCSGVKWDTVTIHFNTVSTAEERFRNVKLSPNPNGGMLMLSGLPDHETIRLTVTDVSGRVIRSATFECAGSYTTELELPDGIYLLRIGCGSASTVRKVVVQR